MSSNLLKLNRNKTQLLVVSSKVRQTKNLLIDMNPEVCNLGVVLDCMLSHHICHQSSFFYTFRFWPLLIDSVAEIHLCANYYNEVLLMISSKGLKKLQYVQNLYARLLTHSDLWEHITH